MVVFLYQLQFKIMLFQINPSPFSGHKIKLRYMYNKSDTELLQNFDKRNDM